MGVLNVSLQIVFPLEAIVCKFAIRIWTQVRPLESMFGLSMADEIFFESEAPIASRLFARKRLLMCPCVPLKGIL